MKKVRKNMIRQFTSYELVNAFISLQNYFREQYPNADIRFDFDKSFYKKDDIKKVKKIKNFKQSIDYLFLLIQELRSRGISMQELTDIEVRSFDNGILTKSYKG